MKLACIAHQGGYDAIPVDAYVDHLYKWAEAYHVTADGRPVAILYDCPDATPSWKCRSDVGIPIHGDVDSAGEVHVRELPAMDVMAYRYDGPASECPGMHRTMHAWLAEHGYDKVGPAIQVYLKHPTHEHGRLVVHAKVEAPIRRKPTKRKRAGPK